MLRPIDYCPVEILAKLITIGYPIEHGDNQKVLLYEAQMWFKDVHQLEIVVLGEKYIGGPYYADIYADCGLINSAVPCEDYEVSLATGISEACDIILEERVEKLKNISDEVDI